MASTLSPTAPAQASAGPDVLRLVMFGLPAAGKSSLLGALAQAAQAQEHLLQGKVVDLQGGLEALRHRLYDETPRRTAEEIVPYPMRFEPHPAPDQKAPPPPLQAVVLDCDGRVANDLLVRRQSLDGNSPEGSLAREVIEADTLILVIDAAAPQEQVENDFSEFDRFLRHMEKTRSQRTEVGGLPVFLVLTKCDLLAQPDDKPADWMERIEQRKREVDSRFREFLHRQEGTEGAVPFGRLDLHVWATAVKRPALAGSPAKPREPYGVAELFHQCFDEAAAFQRMEQRSERRLTWMVGVAGVLVALLLVVSGGLLFFNRVARTAQLQSQIDDLRFAERDAPEKRLSASASQLRTRLKNLETIYNNDLFSALPPESQKYIRDRREELESYLGWLDKLNQERRPGEARSEADLDRLQERLQKELAPPRPEWADTPAGQRWKQTQEEIDALRKAVRRARNWYQDSDQQANSLWTLDGYQPSNPGEVGIRWQEWAAEVEKFLDPNRRPAFTEAELRFESVVAARGKYDADLARLRRLYDLTAALGLTPANKDRPALLVTPRDITLEQCRTRWQELKKVYPDPETRFSGTDLPDAARPAIRQAARASYQNLLGPGRGEVSRQLRLAGRGKEETLERWQEVGAWLKDPKELSAWRELARILVRLEDPEAEDPVKALASFLERTRFPVEVRRMVVEIPDKAGIQPLSDARLDIFHERIGTPAISLEPSGEPRRDTQRRVRIYTYRVPDDRGRITYHPGEAVWATLPLRDRQKLYWWDTRSLVYKIDRLRQPPRIWNEDGSGDGRPADGVRVTFDPEDGVPRVPDLVPQVRLD
jgi:hypothetical protein